MTEAVMRESGNIAQAVKIFKTLHTCGEDTGVRFEVFEMAALYENIIRENNVKLYDDYEDVKKQFSISSPLWKSLTRKQRPEGCHATTIPSLATGFSMRMIACILSTGNIRV